MALRPIFPVAIGQVSKIGPKGVFVNLGFNTLNSQIITGDLTEEQQQDAFDVPQSVWIDNRFNAQPMTLQFLGLPLVLQVRAGRQGVYPLVCATGITRWTAQSVQTAVDVPTVFFNFQAVPWWQDV